MEGALEGLPPNWVVEGPSVTERGTLYIILTGTIEAAMGRDREKVLVAYKQPDDSEQWTAKLDGTVLAEGDRETCLAALVNKAKRINAEWGRLEDFEVPT